MRPSDSNKIFNVAVRRKSSPIPGLYYASVVRLSVCLIQPPQAAAAGLLLWARRPGDIDRLLHALVSDSRMFV